MNGFVGGRRRGLIGVAAVCVVVSGCTISLGNQSDSPPTVPAATIEDDINARLAAAGGSAQSVQCPADLIGELGHRVRCDITTAPDQAFQAVVTVTGLEGDTVDYDVEPAVSRSQLESAVRRMAVGGSNRPPPSVSCHSGLDGEPGAVAYCDVTVGGKSSRRTVAVTDVTGLVMRYRLVTVLPKPVLEQSLLLQLRRSGEQADSASCQGSLDGVMGASTECTTMSAAGAKTYVVTVTALEGDNISFKYARKS